MNDRPAGALQLEPRAEVRQLDLTFARSPAGRSELVARRVAYPWSLTQPFHDDGGDDGIAGMATVIPQSANGGLYAGDRVAQRLAVGAGAAVHMASQGATLVHARRAGVAARSDWQLDLGAGARLEILNDPIVLGPDAALRQRWQASVAPDARLLLIESWTWLTANGAPAFRRFDTALRLCSPAGTLLALDRATIDPAALQRHRAATSPPPAAFATAVIAGPGGDALCAALRLALDEVPQCWSGVSTLPNNAGTVARTAATDAAALQPLSETVWRTVRRQDGMAQGRRRRGY